MCAFLDKLQKLNNYLLTKIKGQESAVSAFSNIICRALTLRGIPHRPKASVLLLGPTGVGKTQIILETVQFLYDSIDGLFQRLDMSEYQHESSIKTLLGETMDQQGLLGIKIDTINQKNEGFFLFDEIEKAHPKLVSIFLQILDCATITMTNGQTKDLSKMILIFTSNLGSANVSRMVNLPYPTIKRHILSSAEKFFSPELFARFNESIVFSRLDYGAQFEICRGLILEELSRIQDLVKTKIYFTEDTILYLLNKGFSSFHGARMLRNTIERELGTLFVNWYLGDERRYQIDSLKLHVENGILKLY